MAVMDEFKEERKALKNGTPKQKLQYFWYYYKWYVFAGIAVIALSTSLIYQIATKKEEAFYAILLNSTELAPAPQYNQGFLDHAGIDMDKYDALFDSSLFISTMSMDETTMASQQKLMVYIAAAQIDVIAGGTEIFEQYAYNDNFYDLRELFDEEKLAAYEPYFYYIDKAVAAKREEAAYNLDMESVPETPDPTRPELMEEPVPVALFVDECQGLMDSYYFSSGERVVLGVVVNTKRPELSVEYIDYLFGN